jgi:hypothetical protein
MRPLVYITADGGLHLTRKNLRDPDGTLTRQLHQVPRQGFARLNLDGHEGLWWRWNHQTAIAFSPGDEDTKRAFHQTRAAKLDQWVPIAFIGVAEAPPAHAPRMRANRPPREEPSGALESQMQAFPLADILQMVEKLARPAKPPRAFDLYAFADYRGAADDGPGVVLVVGVGDSLPVQVAEVRNRRTLDAAWRSLLAGVANVGARLCFGQDHQYGIPIAFARELGIPTNDWRLGLGCLFDTEKARGIAARAGMAGDFARLVNQELHDRNLRDYFWSATKDYGIPRLAPRPNDDPTVYRMTERHGGFPFARIGDNGTVGGQTIVGVPRILTLLDWARDAGVSIAAWPFDGPTLADYDRQAHVMIEPYPSLVREEGVAQSDENDALASTRWAQQHDRAGTLLGELDLSGLGKDVLAQVMYEGWMAGARRG